MLRKEVRKGDDVMPKGLSLTKAKRDWLRQERERRLLSQKEAGKLTGIHPITVSRWESGVANPSRYKLREYLEKLGLKESEIIAIAKV